MNPLYVPDILKIVFSYLSKEDLFQMRLVCSDWDTPAKLTLRTFYETTLKSPADVQKYVSIFASQSQPPLCQKFKFFHTTKYHLIYLTFFQIFGKQIKTLKTTSTTFPNDYAKAVEKYCVNLEELKMLIPRRYHVENIEISFPKSCFNLKNVSISLPFVTTKFLDQLITSGCRLNALMINSKPNLSNRGGKTLKAVELTKFLQNPSLFTFRNLRILDIFILIPESCWITLSQCQFQLEEFSIGMSDGIQDSSIRKFLETQKKSLVKLTTVHLRSQGTTLSPNSLPYLMPRLKYIKTIYSRGTISELVSRMPNLESLELRNHYPHNLDLEECNFTINMDNVFVPGNQLKLLSIHISRGFNGPGEFPLSLASLFLKLGHLFPNLENVEFRTREMSNYESQAILKSMGNLRSLTLSQLE